MKILFRVGIGLLLLAVAVFVAVFLFIDPLVKTVVEKGASYATGVETRLDSVNAGLFSSHLDLVGLAVQNPPGFRSEPFVRLEKAHAAWQNSSLFGDEIHIDEFALDGIEINLERADGKTNYGVILANLDKISPSDDKKTPPPAAPADGKSKHLVVKHIVIRNAKAALHLSGAPLGNGSMNVVVPELEIADFRTDGSTTEIVGKLTKTIVQAVLEGTLKAGQDILPKDLLKDLGGNLDGLKKEAKTLIQNLDLKHVDKTLDGLKGLIKK